MDEQWGLGLSGQEGREPGWGFPASYHHCYGHWPDSFLVPLESTGAGGMQDGGAVSPDYYDAESLL